MRIIKILTFLLLVILSAMTETGAQTRWRPGDGPPATSPQGLFENLCVTDTWYMEYNGSINGVTDYRFSYWDPVTDTWIIALEEDSIPDGGIDFSFMPCQVI